MKWIFFYRCWPSVATKSGFIPAAGRGAASLIEKETKFHKRVLGADIKQRTAEPVKSEP